MGGKKILGISQWLLMAALLVGCDWQEQQTKQSQDDSEANKSQITEAVVNQSPVQESTVITSSKQPDLGAHPGKALHDANCISCHDTGAYQPKTRKINDFPALLAQVRRCDANLNPRLASDDIEQITDYLNQAFYREVR